MCLYNLILISRRESLRRLALAGCAGATALTTAISPSTIFGQPKSLTERDDDRDRDLSILLSALYLEHEAVEAYETGALTSLLPIEILRVGLAFQSDHQYHRDGLIKTIKSLGGTSLDAEERYSFGRLNSVSDILKLARKLEHGAVDAYSTLAANIKSKAILEYAAHVLVDEVRHAVVLDSL